VNCTIRRAASPPGLDGPWDAPPWSGAETLTVAHFRPEGSAHRPVTEARVLHDGATVCVRFRVQDRYVRSVCTRYQDPVCTDSCVEWFVEPKAGRGYVNFEVNAGGTLLCSFIEDPARTPGGFAKWRPLPAEWGRQMEVRHSLPPVVEPELAGPVEWSVAYRVPVALLEACVGPLGDLSGQVWRGNFYKCGDKTSHPHWAAWSPVDALNFHLPHCFGRLRFAR
jgi:hypothetical protein